MGCAGGIVSLIGFCLLALLIVFHQTRIIRVEENSQLIERSLWYIACISGIIGAFCIFAWNEALQSEIINCDLSLNTLIAVLLQQKIGWFASSKTKQVATVALTQKLRSSPQDAYIALSKQHRKFLHESLSCNNESLVLAIIFAVAASEDTQAVPWLAELSGGKWSAEQYRAVQYHAQECLAILKERCREERDQQTLLRSPATDTLSNTLLRPLSSIKQPLPEAKTQLLRPASTEALTASNMNNASLPGFDITALQELEQQVQIGQKPDEDTP